MMIVRFFLLMIFALLPVYVTAQCRLPAHFSALNPVLPADKLPITFPDNTLHIVNFWAVWCAPCRKELPLLAQINREIPVYLLNLGDQPAQAQAFLHSLGISELKQHYLADSQLLQQLQAVGLPLTLLVKDGKILYKLQGILQESDRGSLITYAKCLNKTVSHTTQE